LVNWRVRARQDRKRCSLHIDQSSISVPENHRYDIDRKNAPTPDIARLPQNALLWDVAKIGKKSRFNSETCGRFAILLGADLS